MQLEDMLPNYFTFNGKSFPATETVKAKVGDRILFRLIGSGQCIHPIHIHGGPFQIVATDGNPVPEGTRFTKTRSWSGRANAAISSGPRATRASGCSTATSTTMSRTMGRRSTAAVG
jgi:FtsP/CotA-like multicopper oxidase with cupredoxin domain